MSSDILGDVGRWKANASGRLQQAALELYHEHGYEQTTVAQIAQRAGLTTRTFFRHYADKREVLFGGEDTLHELLVLAIAGAAESTSPLEALAAGLKPAMTIYFEHRPREAARQRHQVIADNAALQERELMKLSRLATSVAEALREHGMAEPAATLTAETGVVIFKVAVERWINDTANRDLSYHIDSLVAGLITLAGPA
jgi:AcrR family transcriptional regulator